MSQPQPLFMNRRHFISLAELIAIRAITGQVVAAEQLTTRAEDRMRILIIGAGLAGLAAARELQSQGQDVIVLEGRDRIGGRISTSTKWPGVPLDLGASWIHGVRGNPLSKVAREVEAKLVPTSHERNELFDTDGDSVSEKVQERLEELRQMLKRALNKAQNGDDLSIRELADQVLQQAGGDQRTAQLLNFLLSSELEHEYSGGARELSAHWHDADDEFEGADVVFADGYQVITQHLASGVKIELGQIVQEIDWRDSVARVKTDKGEFTADRVLVTLPLGVLKSGHVTFTPALPAKKQQAIERLGMGVLNKCYLQFRDVFWDEEADWLEYIPQQHGEWTEWVSFARSLGQPVLLGFNAADRGRKIESWSDHEIIASAMKTLRTIYGPGIPDPIDAQITRWASDPFAAGSYSFNPVGCTPGMREQLRFPLKDRLFFAGEATNADYFGTAHGAYLSGVRAAEEIAATLGKKLKP